VYRFPSIVTVPPVAEPVATTTRGLVATTVHFPASDVIVAADGEPAGEAPVDATADAAADGDAAVVGPTVGGADDVGPPHAAAMLRTKPRAARRRAGIRASGTQP
jgi:hypothetical protein